MDARVSHSLLHEARPDAAEYEALLSVARDEARRLLEVSAVQRASQAYLWSLPLVGLAQWQHEARRAFDMRDTDVVVYESLEDHRGILTADVSMTYIVGLPDLARTGALVVEYPAGSSAGVVMDFWQEPLEYLGDYGPDNGVGATYLITGPGQEPSAHASDFVIRSPTTNVAVGFRALDEDPAHANALIERFNMYPVSPRTVEEPMRLLRTEGRPWSQVPPRGMAYWHRLAEIVQRETSLERDWTMLAQLETLGISRARSFEPGPYRRRVLEEGAHLGEQIARALAIHGPRVGARYRADSRWREVVPFHSLLSATGPDIIDARAAFCYQAVTMSTALLNRERGTHHVCLATHVDSQDRALHGARSYLLRVPPHPPAKHHWSLTIYDAELRTPIDNAQSIASRSSHYPLIYNGDGSVDLFVGAAPRVGWERNWIATPPEIQWFAYLRLSEPLDAYFSHQFALPDFQLFDESTYHTP
jgi:hypothetical protein